MYSSPSSSSMDMEEGIAFVSPAPAAGAHESPPTVPYALPVVARSPLLNQEETTAGGDHDSSSTDQHGANSTHAVAKGKRTKRPRTSAPSSSQQPTPASSASNSYLSGGSGSGAVTEEEEDMANCLIMLAQSDPQGAVGNILKHEERAPGSGRATSRRFAETSVTASGCASAKAGFYVYECKTCSRCFSTFQALGGHRASHKKPTVESSCYGVSGHEPLLDQSEEKTRPLERVMIDRPLLQPQEQRPMMESRIAPTTVSPTAAATTATSVVHHTTHNNNAAVMNMKSNSINQMKSTTARIHECSICGSEFQSGQALGGHMRRHRAAAAAAAGATTTSTALASLPPQLSQVLQVPKKPEPVVVSPTKAMVLPLDLNLPAPSEDADVFPKATPSAPAFPFSVPSKRPPMLFSSSPLVDCHY